MARWASGQVASGEVSHVLTTLANEVAGAEPWICHEAHRSTATVPEAENCRDLANTGPEAWACNPPGDLLILVILMISDVLVEGPRIGETIRKSYLAIGYSYLFVLLLLPPPGNSDLHDCSTFH